MDPPGSHDIYEVKEIVGMKKVGEEYLYKVRWRGYGADSDTWEPPSNFFTCHNVIEEYKSKLSNKGRHRLRPLNRARSSKVRRDRKSSENEHGKRPSPPTYLRSGSKKARTVDLLASVVVDGKMVSNQNAIPVSSKLETVAIKIEPRGEEDDETCRYDQESLEKLAYSKSNNNSSNQSTSRCPINYDLNQRIGIEGKTPLIYASEAGNTKLVEFLLESGASKDLKDAQGNTALILASQNGHYKIVRSLLVHGSNFALINNKGSNALRAAKLIGNDETQMILTKHVSQITMALEKQVIDLLRSTARISHALFPIQCHSSAENLTFRLSFKFDRIEPARPGLGYLLFISDSTFSMFKPVSLKFFSSSAKVKVFLNGAPQRSLTEGAKFVFSFTPLRRGVNELILSIRESPPRKCFIICAYEVHLINLPKPKVSLDR